jgi:hypothetical protein
MANAASHREQGTTKRQDCREEVPAAAALQLSNRLPVQFQFAHQVPFVYTNTPRLTMGSHQTRSKLRM